MVPFMLSGMHRKPFGTNTAEIRLRCPHSTDSVAHRPFGLYTSTGYRPFGFLSVKRTSANAPGQG